MRYQSVLQTASAVTLGGPFAALNHANLKKTIFIPLIGSRRCQLFYRSSLCVTCCYHFCSLTLQQFPERDHPHRHVADLDQEPNEVHTIVQSK